MKVLFVYTNINGMYYDSFGDGVAQIMAVTSKAGHEIRNVQIVERSEYSTVSEMVHEFKPDVVGFTSVSSQFAFVLEFAEIIKKISPKIINVCGGVHPTLYPQCIMESKNLDAIFMGDSEYSFLEFLEKVEKKQSWKEVDNIAYNDNGKLKRNKLKKLLNDEELGQLPHPDRTTYPFDKVLQRVGMAPFHFSGFQFYAAQLAIAAISAPMEAIEMVSVQYTGGVLVGHYPIACPESLGAVVLHCQERCAFAVAGGNEHQIAADDGRGRVDRRIDGGAPGESEQCPAGVGIDRLQSGAREEKRLLPALKFGEDGGGIAGVVGRGFPAQFAAVGIKRDNSCAVLAADIQQDMLVVHQWRTGNAKKPKVGAVLLLCIHLPKRFSAP